jgi:hypothetical protein
LTIISGQHIPKANQDLESEVVDPYVTVKIVGHPADAQKFKTDIVRNNGEAQLVGGVVCSETVPVQLNFLLTLGLHVISWETKLC